MTGLFAVSAMLIKSSHSGTDSGPLVVHRLYKTYHRNQQTLPWKKELTIPVLKDVSLSLKNGQILGVCGPSGSGKSTLARCVACLEGWDSGDIIIAGHRVDKTQPQLLRQARLHVQLVFQDAAASLNPNFSALEIVREPLDILGKGSRRERYHASMVAMEHVGLGSTPAARNVNELSGGQRQRLALARALTIEPAVLVLDETLSSVDLGVQAQIINLLLDLQTKLSMSYVFISHNLRLARHLADEIVIMEAGRIARRGSGEEVFKNHRSSN
jgi:oligopeptide transport system ATP-binding protein